MPAFEIFLVSVCVVAVVVAILRPEPPGGPTIPDEPELCFHYPSLDPVESDARIERTWLSPQRMFLLGAAALMALGTFVLVVAAITLLLVTWNEGTAWIMWTFVGAFGVEAGGLVCVLAWMSTQLGDIKPSSVNAMYGIRRDSYRRIVICGLVLVVNCTFLIITSSIDHYACEDSDQLPCPAEAHRFGWKLHATLACMIAAWCHMLVLSLVRGLVNPSPQKIIVYKAYLAQRKQALLQARGLAPQQAPQPTGTAYAGDSS